LIFTIIVLKGGLIVECTDIKRKRARKREKLKLLSILLPFAMLSVPVKHNCP